jgi:hypothetical protein
MSPDHEHEHDRGDEPDDGREDHRVTARRKLERRVASWFSR